MNIEITCTPKFWFQLTIEHINILLKLSDAHYDGVCQDASRVGGFIYGWKNQVVWYNDSDCKNDEPPNLCADFRKLDTALKIMENSHILATGSDAVLVAEMRRCFLAALRRSNEEMPKLAFIVLDGLPNVTK